MIIHYIGNNKSYLTFNQVDLDKLIETCGFQKFDIVHNKNTEIKTPGQCDIILEVVKDISNIEYTSNKTPRFLRVMSCFIPTNNVKPYTYLRTVEDLVKISTENYKNLIEPIIDQLQNCIEQK